jgi:hypothetical protein
MRKFVIPPLGAGCTLRRHPPARRRLQPASRLTATLPLCTLGYAERKIPSGDNQNRYLMLFVDRHGFTALQAVQSGSVAYNCDVGWSLRRAGRGRRRLEPAPSGGNPEYRTMCAGLPRRYAPRKERERGGLSQWRRPGYAMGGSLRHW